MDSMGSMRGIGQRQSTPGSGVYGECRKVGGLIVTKDKDRGTTWYC